MPIFEWGCPKCSNKKETLQRYSDPAPKCSDCINDKGEPIEMAKKVSLSSFSLNGTGWAKDNYGLKK